MKVVSFRMTEKHLKVLDRLVRMRRKEKPLATRSTIVRELLDAEKTKTEKPKGKA